MPHKAPPLHSTVHLLAKHQPARLVNTCTQQTPSLNRQLLQGSHSPSLFYQFAVTQPGASARPARTPDPPG